MKHSLQEVFFTCIHHSPNSVESFPTVFKSIWFKDIWTLHEWNGVSWKNGIKSFCEKKFKECWISNENLEQNGHQFETFIYYLISTYFQFSTENCQKYYHNQWIIVIKDDNWLDSSFFSLTLPQGIIVVSVFTLTSHWTDVWALCKFI